MVVFRAIALAETVSVSANALADIVAERPRLLVVSLVVEAAIKVAAIKSQIARGVSVR